MRGALALLAGIVLALPTLAVLRAAWRDERARARDAAMTLPPHWRPVRGTIVHTYHLRSY